MLLADIGNTHFHIYNGREIEHLSHVDAIAKYKDEVLSYISVKQHLNASITEIPTWTNIANLLEIEGEYDTMGVDRKALCFSHDNGMFIDAGSAITVDVVEEGVYIGGYIFPGFRAILKSYAEISDLLDVELNRKISLTQLPKTTKDGISYGIIASIKALIEQERKNKVLYFTGGDGHFLSTFFEDANYDEMLVFYGMQRAIREQGLTC